MIRSDSLRRVAGALTAGRIAASRRFAALAIQALEAAMPDAGDPAERRLSLVTGWPFTYGAPRLMRI